MKYTKEERLDIGRRIYNGELTRFEAAVQYGVSENTARDYMQLYRDINQLPPKSGTKYTYTAASLQSLPASMEELAGMTKEELIQEVIKARISEARLKKGYEVKGDGSVILYGSKNIK